MKFKEIISSFSQSKPCVLGPAAGIVSERRGAAGQTGGNAAAGVALLHAESEPESEPEEHWASSRPCRAHQSPSSLLPKTPAGGCAELLAEGGRRRLLEGLTYNALEFSEFFINSVYKSLVRHMI